MNLEQRLADYINKHLDGKDFDGDDFQLVYEVCVEVESLMTDFFVADNDVLDFSQTENIFNDGTQNYDNIFYVELKDSIQRLWISGNFFETGNIESLDDSDINMYWIDSSDNKQGYFDSEY